MRRLNFLPIEYINKVNRKKKRILNVFVVVFLLINIYLLIIIHRTSIEYKDIIYNQKEITNSISNLNTISKESTVTEKEQIKFIRIYEDLKAKISGGTIKDIEIVNNEIKARVEYSDLKGYIEFIKEVEKDKTFKIVDLQPPIESEQHIETFITMEYVR